jgi:hypothetical protein
MATSFPVKITQDGFPVSITDIPNNWIPIGTNVNKGTARITTSQTSRILCVPQLDVNAVKLVYSNIYTGGTGETPNTNKILVRASIQPMGSTINENIADPIYRVTFGGGNDNIIINSGETITSDPLPVTFLKNTKFFVKSYGTPIGSSAPTAPIVVASGSGSSLNGTYGVCISIVYPNGYESLPSTSTSTVVASGLNMIVTSPTAINGALGYRVWTTVTNGSGSGSHYDNGGGVINFETSYTITSIPTSASLQSIESVDPTGALYLPVGGGIAGGTNAGGSNTGEYQNISVDYTLEGKTGTVLNSANIFSPINILGYNAISYEKSCAIIGDSISAGVADYGFYRQKGGFMLRSIMSQINTLPYDVSINPTIGNIFLGQSGETALQFAANSGWKRSLIANTASTVWSNYGTNDLANNSITIISSIYTIAKRFLTAGKTFIQSDILPKTSSTDYWVTIDNQSFSILSEVNRRQLNNWISQSSTNTTIINEIPMRRASGNGGISYDFYSGGDGTTLIFISNLPFIVGTEQIYKNSTLQTVSTNYTYLSQTTINGISYASGISFVTAPTSGMSITINYTSIPNMVNLLGSKCKYMPTAKWVEYNSSGIQQLNGGFFKISEAPVVGPKTATTMASSSITDTTQSWTTDQYRGWCVAIVSDTVTPSSVGQVRVIQSNTSNLLTLPSSFSPTPSSSATYQIYKSYMSDGTHPSSQGNLEIAKNINITLID